MQATKSSPILTPINPTSAVGESSGVVTQSSLALTGQLLGPAISADARCLVCQSRLQLHPSLLGQSDGSQQPNQSSTGGPNLSGISAFGRSEGSGKLFPITGDDEEIEGRFILGGSISDSESLSGKGGVAVAQSGNLLDLIAHSQSPMEVPMCKKCAGLMQQELDRQLESLRGECSRYKSSLDQLLTQQSKSNYDPDTARRKLALLELEEKELLEELASLEAEESALNQELEQKLDERRKMAEKDDQLYRQLRDNHRILLEQADEHRSLKAQLKWTQEQLQRLQRVNVLDMVFFIWIDGEYGTISGLRLGRLKHDPVEWVEINAALGQCVFLLQVISERIGMQFTGGYELIPCASYSFIRVTRGGGGNSTGATGGGGGKVEELPMYGSGGWKPFGQSPLDQALVAFLECFTQVEQHLRQFFPQNTQILPYRIVKDKLVDKDTQYSVKMQLNSEERWTKAMKCLLLNLKRVVSILATLTNNGTLPEPTPLVPLGTGGQQPQPSPSSGGGPGGS